MAVKLEGLMIETFAGFDIIDKVGRVKSQSYSYDTKICNSYVVLLLGFNVYDGQDSS